MSLRPLLLPPLVLALASCSTMTSLKDGTIAGAGQVGRGIGGGFDKVAGLATSPFRPGVPVVEARQDQWKDLPSGRERALAYQEKQRQRRSFWIFGGPVDFDEPDLPDLDGESATASLLPPKN